jgi:hypothetical protein
MADAPKASSAGDGNSLKTRPEKPDQAKFEADLAAADKEHAERTEKFVRHPSGTGHLNGGFVITLQ